MTAGERFVISKNAEEKRAGRREILEEAECRQAEITRGVTEPEQRHGSDDACAHEQDRQGKVRRTENERAVSLEKDEIDDGDRDERDRFDEKAGNSGGAGLFTE